MRVVYLLLDGYCSNEHDIDIGRQLITISYIPTLVQYQYFSGGRSILVEVLYIVVDEDVNCINDQP